MDFSVLFHCKLLEGRDCIFMFMVLVKYLANGRCSCQYLALAQVFFSRICALAVTSTIFGAPLTFFKLDWVPEGIFWYLVCNKC